MEARLLLHHNLDDKVSSEFALSGHSKLWRLRAGILWRDGGTICLLTMLDIR